MFNTYEVYWLLVKSLKCVYVCVSHKYRLRTSLSEDDRVLCDRCNLWMTVSHLLYWVKKKSKWLEERVSEGWVIRISIILFVIHVSCCQHISIGRWKMMGDTGYRLGYSLVNICQAAWFIISQRVWIYLNRPMIFWAADAVMQRTCTTSVLMMPSANAGVTPNLTQHIWR